LLDTFPPWATASFARHSTHCSPNIGQIDCSRNNPQKSLTQYVTTIQALALQPAVWGISCLVLLPSPCNDSACTCHPAIFV